MKFSDIMLLVGSFCVLNAIWLWVFLAIPGWWFCKGLALVGVNCLMLALVTAD